ncbi:hypothetical protein [Paenibacillus odorifer]|uniref:Lactococcin 972 family bacteriocin n=1 Tax=Paenibacillus odorifer TaxID=189426 RepID=A0A1R0XS64_9BACL|nr:hypothetical protein [Paenibacillus odorifer]OMD37994.1 hypothetical protein BSK52_20570 [Paenibacillus odorifer]
MKKSMKLMLSSSLLSIALLATAVPGFADSVGKTSGGWSESEGYYTNSSTSELRLSVMASSSPDEHHGERKTRDALDNSGDIESAAYGYTVWKNVLHYTTAQMEDNKGTVRTTSGRQWGTGGTTAQSPWYRPGIFENSEARTYWGK